MISGVLLDLSGVLYVGRAALPGAAQALVRLQEAGLPVAYVTNVTRTPRATLLDRLRAMELPIATDALFTAPMVVRDYCRRHALTPYLLVHPELAPDLEDLAGGAPNAVVVGDAGEGFTYAGLNAAFRLLMAGAPLLAMGRTRYFQDIDGLSLDAGPFVAALEVAAGTAAVTLGKPAREFFHAGVRHVGCPVEDAVMIGDDVHSDVEGALDAGLQAILVRTGKYRAGDEDAVRSREAPVVADVSAAVDWILAHR